MGETPQWQYLEPRGLCRFENNPEQGIEGTDWDLMEFETEQECADTCLDISACVGYEYELPISRCEIWKSKPTFTADKDGAVCVLKKPTINKNPHLLNPNTEVNGHRVMILECETGYTFVNDTRTDFYCNYDRNTTSNSGDILDPTERCNTIPDVCWRSTPCPPNSDGESVEKGCTCRTGYLGAVYATMVFPYFEGGCVYDDPDPCNVSDIVLPLGASTSEAFCGEGIVQIESGDVCVPHCDDDYVPNKDFVLCQDTQFLDIDTLRCVRKCDAPVNVLRGVSDPCNEGLKIDPSFPGSESFCTLSSRSCETGYEASLQKLKCANGTLTPSTFECVEMCRAPNPIKYVKAGSTRFESMGASNGGFSCQEGEYVSPDSNCTTRCQSGYVPDTETLSCTTDSDGNRVVEPSGFVCNQLVPLECRVESDIPAHCFPPCLTNDATPDDAVGVNMDQGGKCGDSSSNVRGVRAWCSSAKRENFNDIPQISL